MLITKTSRTRYEFPLEFFRPEGQVFFRSLSSARAFAARMSARRADPPPASDLYAISLLDEAYHLLLVHYSNMIPAVMDRAREDLQSGLGPKYGSTLERYLEEYPPNAVYRGETTAGDYLKSNESTFDEFDRDLHTAAMQEMLLINNANNNPALQPYIELFDHSVMNGSPYQQFVRNSIDFFASQAGLGKSATSRGETLDEILAGPIKTSPHSIEGQLRFVIERWGDILGEGFTVRILRGLDFIREEIIRRGGPHPFKPEAQVYTFSGRDYADYERYSPDMDWMPRLVLVAKNSYVWLDQLSRKYRYEIRTLDQIPNEELDLLAARGFTGLWLIGLWERSRASRRIKQRMGQEDAVASAYSLHSYDIASDLGGWGALQNLRARAWERGIRLSADMVPNHMGIDSAWVIEHPDWFLSLPHSPYPSYSFDSENLSDDRRVGIHIEDHYYDRTDAAVVFQRRDLQTGDQKFIYHGNDGTSFPWNDTAQLDYSKAEVREAVIQTILHVARNFPVIRFDAAMTLARKHIQRLWFPQPGAGGAIPSRAQYGLTQAEFDAAMPNEFWREVVDRVAAEVPDTLLLAEAFWLMEGYFVRTLGMHRVYNSAFMHMLRDEENAKYRMAIKNTLEFDPQILKRYVNFMNNPDEKTAIEQFGSGDKYFGTATLLSTLPGLPMFGHGQVEGFYEKYGMEFRRAKWDEHPSDDLVRGHEWRIFPLLHRRSLFADVEQFLLYDFYTARGGVNEDVFAFSNRLNDERGLVIYHNKFADTRGWVKASAAYIDKGSGNLRQRNLADGLGLPDQGFVIFKDYVTQLEYIRSCRELKEKGLYIELGAYQCHVFMDFRFVEGDGWEIIHDTLNGAGLQSMQAKWNELFAVQEVPVEIPPQAVLKRKPAIKKKVVGGGKPADKRSGKKAAGQQPIVSSKKKVDKKPAAQARSKPKAAKRKKPSKPDKQASVNSTPKRAKKRSNRRSK